MTLVTSRWAKEFAAAAYEEQNIMPLGGLTMWRSERVWQILAEASRQHRPLTWLAGRIEALERMLVDDK